MDLEIKLKIKTQEKEIELTYKEAEELYFELKKIFNKDWITVSPYSSPTLVPCTQPFFTWTCTKTDSGTKG